MVPFFIVWHVLYGSLSITSVGACWVELLVNVPHVSWANAEYYLLTCLLFHTIGFCDLYKYLGRRYSILESYGSEN